MSSFNHYDEFCKFVNSQEILSQAFKDKLTVRLSAAMADAYARGADSQRRPEPPILRSKPLGSAHMGEPEEKAKLDTLTRKQKKELRDLKANGGLIPAIKRLRELKGSSLLAAKQYVETL